VVGCEGILGRVFRFLVKKIFLFFYFLFC